MLEWSKTVTNRKETGAVIKRWHGKTSIALVFPASYRVGMANLGVQTVYANLNDHEDIVAERFFSPENPNVKWLSEESSRPLRDFDLILLSISFETGYLTALEAIHGAGIPLFATERGNAEPLIIAGGVATFINPEPFAPFVDAFLLGDFEAIDLSFSSYLKSLTDKGISRKKRLSILQENVPGAYIPSLFKPEYDNDGKLLSYNGKPVLPALSKEMQVAPHSKIISSESVFPDMHLVELTRGCGRGCRFCAAGFVYRPPRTWSKEASLRAIEEKKNITRVGLVGLEYLDRNDIEELCRDISGRGLNLSFSSLRADCITPSFVSLLKASRTRLATIAPEAGTERMRRVINKNLDEASILKAAETLAKAGIPDIKLYFMIGLPGETEEDVHGIIRLSKKIKEIILPFAKRRGRMGRIIASVSIFVPKAWTPFQWVGFENEKSLRKKVKILRKSLAREPNIDLKVDSIKEAMKQAILSRSDRRLAPMLEAMAIKKMGLREALREFGPLAEAALSEKDISQPLAWDIVGNRVKKEYLISECKKAWQEKQTPFCDTKKCKRCGACF